MTERPHQPLPPGVPNEAPPKPRAREYPPPNLSKEPPATREKLGQVQDYFKAGQGSRAERLRSAIRRRRAQERIWFWLKHSEWA